MLLSLSIRNFVLIEDDTLEFGPGLTALTGETGAGKTLLTQALELLLGERAGDGLVGRAAEDAMIQAVFLLSAESLAAIPEDVRDLAALGPGELVATRRLQATGRNRAFLNGTAVTLGVLAQALGGLVAFSGQHEHRRLVEPRYQRTVLDAFSGEQSAALLRDYEDAWAEARQAEALLHDGERSAEERRQERELLAFQVGELEAAGLSLAEEEDLERRQRLLSRAEEVVRATADAAELARSEGDRPDAAGLLSSARSRLSSVAGLDPQVDDALASLEEALVLVDDAARELRRAADQVEVDPAGAALVEERLRVYLDLGRKYGGSTPAAVAFLEEGRARLAVLDAVEEDLAGARARRERAVERALGLAAELTTLRRTTAPLLERAIERELEDLGMTDTRVAVAVETGDGWTGLGPTGADAVEFLLAPNPGLPLRPLARTASGGELSRSLLAIKGALAGLEGAETLVFDEVDAGIGGRTATAVGQKLHQLAEENQVLVITHLPQVAAFADQQVRIEKSTGESGAVTRLVPLDEDGALEELARMLGGRPGDAEALAHARALRDRATSGLLD